MPRAQCARCRSDTQCAERVTHGQAECCAGHAAHGRPNARLGAKQVRPTARNERLMPEGEQLSVPAVPLTPRPLHARAPRAATSSCSMLPVFAWCLRCENFHEKYGVSSALWSTKPTASLSKGYAEKAP